MVERSSVPDATAAKAVNRLAYENGLVIASSSTHANTIRILSPSPRLA
jgi:4-aminobutyrate aminotransferase-like enzyme